MRLGICGKYASAASICTSEAKSLSEVRTCHTFSKWAAQCMVLLRLQQRLRIRCLHLDNFWTERYLKTWKLKGSLHPRQQTAAGLTTIRFCGNSLLMLLWLWSVSSHLLSLCSSLYGWQKKKIPLLISSDSVWPRLLQEGRLAAWWGLRRLHGLMMERKRCHKHVQAKTPVGIKAGGHMTHVQTTEPHLYCCRWGADIKNEKKKGGGGSRSWQ